MSVTTPDFTPTIALFSLWAIFMASWAIAALWRRPTVGGAGFRASLPLYAGLALAIALLIWARSAYPILTEILWNFGPTFGWTMVVVTGLALAFCWWARLHLGALWSAGIARKEGHRVIDSGPYSIVRHPIYAGLIVAMFAMAAERARLAPIILAIGVAVFFTLKARLEERFLRAELGSGYDAYRARVPMIVPFVRARPRRAPQ